MALCSYVSSLCVVVAYFCYFLTIIFVGAHMNPFLFYGVLPVFTIGRLKLSLSWVVVLNCFIRSVARGFIILKPTKIFGELRDI